MTPQRWSQIKALFHGSLDHPEDARAAWLREECGHDAALLADVNALLHSHATIGAFLDHPAEVDPEDLAAAVAHGTEAASPAPLDGAAWVPGDRIGEYDIVQPLARGGMGIVYLATDRRLGRRVALKSLPTTLADEPAMRERLKREARAAATIADPAVATIYSLEEVDGHLLLASEFVDGPSLRVLIDAGPLALDRVRAIAIDIARGLRAAHGAGVIHRDLKPENVVIAPGGAAKIVDFGIAALQGTDHTKLTRAGAMLGTPAYMAPEQILGGPADARTDLFALGVILSEMLSGQHPLTPPEAGRDDRRHTASEAALAQVLARVASQCHHPDPARRFSTAAEVLAILETLTFATPLPLPATAAEPASRWWWEFHQAATAIAYAAILFPAWLTRQTIGGTGGRTFFIVVLCAAIAGIMLRLHLWFASRQHPQELRWARARAGRWIRGADLTLVATLVIGAVFVGGRSALDLVLLGIAVGVAAASMLIEPVTARAAGIDATT